MATNINTKEPTNVQISLLHGTGDSVALLDDPTRTPVTVTQAAAIFGVSPATAHHAHH